MPSRTVSFICLHAGEDTTHTKVTLRVALRVAFGTILIRLRAREDTNSTRPRSLQGRGEARTTLVR